MSVLEAIDTVSLRDPVADGYCYAPASADVVCFEPMTAPANALASGSFELAPYAATFSVRVA